MIPVSSSLNEMISSSKSKNQLLMFLFHNELFDLFCMYFRAIKMTERGKGYQMMYDASL